MNQARVVCIGNGTGQATLLRGLRRQQFSPTAIVGVTDNGGHSGLIRASLDIPAPGDCRACLESLADADLLITRLLSYRFLEGELTGVSLGNLMLAALSRSAGSLSRGVTALSALLHLQGEVLPVSDDSSQICAELEDGRTVVGEWQIIQRQPPSIPIRRLFHQHPFRALASCLQVIAAADLIVFAPGALRTGIISTLLAEGLREALLTSAVPKVYVCNLMTQPDQTDHFTVNDHLQELGRYLGSPPDYVIANNGAIPQEQLTLYDRQGARAVVVDAVAPCTELIVADVVQRLPAGKWQDHARPPGRGMRVAPHFIRHDPDRLAEVIIGLSRKVYNR